MSEMRTVGELVLQALGAMDCPDHVPAEPGDYVDADGYLHCGRCRKRKEFRREIAEMGVKLVLPCLCDCTRAIRDAEELRARQSAMWAAIDALPRGVNILRSDGLREARFSRCTETPENAAVIKKARNYARRFDEMLSRGGGLYLYGAPGRGKTYLAACIANALTDNRRPVLGLQTAQVTSYGAFGADANARANMLRAAISAELLIVDDLGTERTTETAQEALFRLLDARVCAGKPMIITSNYPPEALAQSVDWAQGASGDAELARRRARIMDRVLGRCMPIELRGKSWRIANARTIAAEINKILEGEND